LIHYFNARAGIGIETKSTDLIILSLYRAPSGDINEILKRLDTILKCLYSPESEFIIYGDININHLNENDRKQQINSLLKTHNLSHSEFSKKSSKFRKHSRRYYFYR
jgi:hypothetical protein